MSLHLTNRPRHAAPRAPRTAPRFARFAAALLSRRTLPAVAETVVVPQWAPVVPSMALPDGYLEQRNTAVATERVRVIDPADECFSRVGVVCEYYGADAPIVVLIPVRQACGGHKLERRQYSTRQLSPVLDTPDRGAAPTLIMEPVTDRPSGEEPPGVGHLVHFEASELEFTAAVTR